MTKSGNIAGDLRELIVQLSRGNAGPAHTIARRVQEGLNIILSTDTNPASTLRQQARQTLFAIEEVLELIDRTDFREAWQSSRDAAKEWRAAQAQD